MGRVVAIGGGELDTTHGINKYIVELADKKNPNLLFIGTASHDAEGYISAIRTEFESLGCVVRALCLTTTTYKGTHLVDGDKWKEDFLLDLEATAVPKKTFVDDNKYKIWGFHFFNQDVRSAEFADDMQRIV